MKGFPMKTDSFWKEVLEKLFKEFLQFFFPQIHRVVDFTKGYQFLDKEFQQITKTSKTNKKIVDKLVKVYLRDGEEKWLLIHIEIQGQKQKDFAQRMFTYYYRIFDKYQRDVLSLALLTDMAKEYRPDTYSKNYLGLSLSFKFPLVKIVDYINYSFEKEYKRNVFSLIVQAFLKTVETEGDYQNRYYWKRTFLLQLYDFGLERETVFNAYQFIEWIMALPKTLDEQLYYEVKQQKEIKGMGYITIAERKGMKEGLKKGRKEGIQKGIQKGIQEGIQKGKIEGLRQAIESVLEVKFNSVDEEIINRLNKINSVEKLEELLDAAKLTESTRAFKEKLLTNK